MARQAYAYPFADLIYLFSPAASLSACLKAPAATLKGYSQGLLYIVALLKVIHAKYESHPEIRKSLRDPRVDELQQLQESHQAANQTTSSGIGATTSSD